MNSVQVQDLQAINAQLAVLIEGVTTSLRAITELQHVVEKMAGDEIPDVDF